MNIGFLGGTFDPIHSGHIYAAREAAKALSLDEVIFIPAGIPPHKPQSAAPAFHRLNMVHLALRGEPVFSVSDYEINKETPSYTYQTLEHFKSIYKEDRLFFIVGDEAFAGLDKWRCPERITAAATVAVVARRGIKPEGNALFIEVPHMQASSTEIREGLKRGKLPDGVLDERVLAYIRENGLYA